MQEQQNKSIEQSIIRTLAYSDIFDYPLKLSEIHKFYSGANSISKILLKDSLNLAVRFGRIQRNGDYYFLPGRNSIVNIREIRQRASVPKLKIAKRTVRLLKNIPTVKLIGISGSLASRNSEKNDDIDLFFITSKNTLWLSRFLVNIVLILFGKKRGRFDFIGTNKICPNMYMDEGLLSIGFDRRNIFTAREAGQLLVLFDKNNFYERFLYDNKWILNFLPHIKISDRLDISHNENKILTLVDRFFFILQFIYMSGRITQEEVRPHLVRFHPQDRMHPILELHKQRCRIYLTARNTRLPAKALAMAGDTRGTPDTLTLDTPGY